MQTVTSTEFQNKFGEYLEMSRIEPVEITRNGRTAAIMIPPEDFKTYQAMVNAYWAALAREAQKEPDVSEKEVMARLQKRIDESGE